MTDSEYFDVTGGEAHERAIDELLTDIDYSTQQPWTAFNGGGLEFVPDIEILRKLFSIPVAQATGHRTGRLGRVIDAWVAHELRRAGFGEHEVFPRRVRPRILHDPLPRILSDPNLAQEERARRVIVGYGSGRTGAVGELYHKEVDVFMGSIDRGPELMVSTKSMSSSFAKNLKNRYEEFLGDAENLRRRFPLATLGVVFVVHADILQPTESGSFKRLVEMLLRLRRSGRYDTTSLIVMRPWDAPETWPNRKINITELRALLAQLPIVDVDETPVPFELRMAPMLQTLVLNVLDNIPDAYHSVARARLAQAPTE